MSSQRLLLAVVAALTAATALAACTGEVRGHAEIGTRGDTMDLGAIESGVTDRTLRVDAEAIGGTVRLELVGPDAVVTWTSTATPESPINEDVRLPANAGPWQVRLTALEASSIVDYRVRVR